MKKFVVIFMVLVSSQAFSQNFEKLEIGRAAIDFKVNTIQGKEVQLSEINKSHPVVLVVLRGWPGYQCPVCSRQVGDLLADADDFAALNASVFMVYPGPSEQMQEHAKEFSKDFEFPEHFYFTLDPDYSMINIYGLRWEKVNETAYPSAFVINKNGEIVFSKISMKHGGRADNKDILEALSEL